MQKQEASADDERVRRRQELYGAGRCLAREAAQKRLVEDHVEKNFKQGAKVVHDNQVFQTTMAGDYGQKKIQDYHRFKPKSGTYVQFGYDSPSSMSVTQMDYAGLSTPEFQLHTRDAEEINLADFAPRYRVSDITGHSQYTQDYSKEKQSAAKAGEREESARFRYHISTHFDLGNHEESLTSETSRSFGKDRDTSFTVPTSQASKGCSKSSVFREGDYNMTTRNTEGCFTTTQKRDFAEPQGPLAAGVSTVTRKPYSHVLPKVSPECAVSALRKFLIAKNEEEFKNPRDPTTMNVVKAFAAYDQQKSGSLSVEDLKAMCEKFDIPIDRDQIQRLLRECNCEEEGKIDFVKFCEYLTAHREPPKTPSDFTSTNQATYSNTNQACLEDSAEDHKGRTNFVFGYDERASNTVYTKDFNPSRLKGVIKPSLISSLPCSKVMHEHPVIRGSSTSVTTQDFVQHKLESGRLQKMQNIGAKHREVGVDLGSEPVGDSLHKSVAAMSFSKPKSTAHAELIRPNFDKYHHLESNQALPHPLVLDTSSEAQSSYKAPYADSEEECAAKKREVLENRDARVQTNKATHFIVGYDTPEKETEQMSEFTSKKPLERNIMAAGRPDLPTKGYSIIAHDSGEIEVTRGAKDPQQILQQRNYLKNINPRDTVNLNLRKAFLEYDKNLSGAISKDDLKTVCKEMEVPLSESEMNEIISRCDLKGDGLIDYHEFSLNLSRLKPPGVAPWNQEESITRRDFKHPKDQQIDPKQKVMQEKDSKRFEPVEIHPSCLLQWAPQADGLQSTHMKDYRAPESVTGQ